jgi:4-hydroxybenzoate polyprenyltransferase
MDTLIQTPRQTAPTTRWKDCIRLIRPHQWTKNIFCFAGMVFSGRLHEPGAWLAATTAFLVFAAASSCSYIINDLCDLERDRKHPQKRLRPLASGRVNRPTAIVMATLLGLLAIAGIFFLSPRTYACVIAFLLLNVLYSRFLKHEVLIDVAGIALGFVLRLLAGVYAVDELPTTWITLCTFFLALFLGFAKRRAELADLLNLSNNEQRPVLAKYNLDYLDALVNSTATMTIMTYALFTVSSGRNPTLIITVPFVHIAIMHYKLLISNREGGQEPDRIVLHSRPIQLCIILWLATYLWIVRANIHLFR